MMAPHDVAVPAKCDEVVRQKEASVSFTKLEKIWHVLHEYYDIFAHFLRWCAFRVWERLAG